MAMTWIANSDLEEEKFKVWTDDAT
jgi:hypothetical protein